MPPVCICGLPHSNSQPKKNPKSQDLGFFHLGLLLFVGTLQVLVEPVFECHLNMASLR